MSTSHALPEPIAGCDVLAAPGDVEINNAKQAMGKGFRIDELSVIGGTDTSAERHQ